VCDQTTQWIIAGTIAGRRYKQTMASQKNGDVSVNSALMRDTASSALTAGHL
jgi:hypothetical protein